MGKKDKLQYVTNEEIEEALKKARTGRGAAKLLGVCFQALYSEIKKRGKGLFPTLRDI